MGRPAVFCRFAGCNLWSGREEDRLTAVCTFCDTDFVGTDGPGGGRFGSALHLVKAVAAAWPAPPSALAHPCDGAQGRPACQGTGRPFVVCAGGEPLLQLDDALVDAFHEHGFEIAIETNGTRLPPKGIEWICVSPKAEADLILIHGNELKLIYPQPGAEPTNYERLDFRHFFLQPMDGPDLARNTRLAVEYCLCDPRWRLSCQLHKLWGIP